MEIVAIDDQGGIPRVITEASDHIDSSSINPGNLEEGFNLVPGAPLEAPRVVMNFPEVGITARPNQLNFNLVVDPEKFSYITPQSLAAQIPAKILDKDTWELSEDSPLKPYLESESLQVVNPTDSKLNKILDALRFLLYYDDTIKTRQAVITVVLRGAELPLVITLMTLLHRARWGLRLVGEIPTHPNLEWHGTRGVLNLSVTTARGENHLEIPVESVKTVASAYNGLKNFQAQIDAPLTVISFLRRSEGADIGQAILRHNREAISGLTSLGPGLHRALWQFNLPWGSSNNSAVISYPKGLLLKQLFGGTSSTLTSMIVIPRDLQKPPIEWNPGIYEQQLNYFNMEERHKQPYTLTDSYPVGKPEGFDLTSRRMILTDLGRFLGINEPEVILQFQENFLRLVKG